MDFPIYWKLWSSDKKIILINPTRVTKNNWFELVYYKILSAVSHRSIIWLSLSPYFAQLQSTVVLITILLVTKTENQIPWATAFRYNFVPWNRCYVISIEPQVIRKSSCLCETNVIHHTGFEKESILHLIFVCVNLVSILISSLNKM